MKRLAQGRNIGEKNNSRKEMLAKKRIMERKIGQ